MPRPRPLAPYLLRFWRLAALIAAAWLLPLEWLLSTQPPDSVALENARHFFPDAARLDSSRVLSADGKVLGSLLTTAPQSDDLVGYSGPSNLLIALDPAGKIAGVELLSSEDTPAHIAEVRKADSFWRGFVGWTPTKKIEAVGGSTLTSLAMAEAVARSISGHSDSLRFPEPLTLDEVRALFPKAAIFFPEKKRAGWHSVHDAGGALLGFAVRTSPHSDNVRGYAGPTESFAAVTPDRSRVTAIRLRKSYDTPEYVERVRDDKEALAALANRSVTEWAAMDFKKAGIEGISGATQTSYAVAEGLRRRFAADEKSVTSLPSVPFRDAALIAVVLGALIIAFTPLRGKRWLRLVWQAVLIGGFGLWFGQLLSLSLIAGWARHGIPWQAAPALALLAAIALLVPWGARRQIYCHHLCPHGAAQEWLGKFPRLHLRMPAALHRWLTRLPATLLILAFALALATTFDLAKLEPFDAWILRSTALASAIIAVAGLVASIFIPQAYCHYGCPTGALLKFIRSPGASDRFGARDWTALVTLTAAAAFVFLKPHPSPAPLTELRGAAFGSTWSVKSRTPFRDDTHTKIAAELERIESTLSHWRPGSATSQFNAAGTTLPLAMPPELIALVSQCLEISRASDGAFDITVAPLVQAWGQGPGGAPRLPPDDAKIESLRTHTGWQKLTVDAANGTLQKSDARLQIDLGAILQGYAADRLAALLASEGISDCLIEVGGELLARGKWEVAIENPAHPGQPIRRLSLQNAALSTSGTYRAKHLINPATGRPITHDTALVAITRPTCAEADAWATALIVIGGENARILAEKRGIKILTITVRSEQRGSLLREGEAPAEPLDGTHPPSPNRRRLGRSLALPTNQDATSCACNSSSDTNSSAEM